jgi:thymidylate synthase (FAD)
MFVKNQWMRHRTGKYNEISARYTQMDDHFWFPRSNDLRTQSSTNHQCSGTGTPSITNNELTNSGKSIAESYRCYENLLTAGVAREQARAILPLNIFTKFYFTMDLHNLLHFLELRLAPDAQPEIRYYAEAIVKIIKPMIPMTWKAFEDFTLNKITFTGPEVAAIKSLKLEAMLPTTNFATARERAEFIEKIKRLFVTV